MDQHLVKLVPVYGGNDRPEGLPSNVSHILVEVGYWRNNYILDQFLDELLGDDGYERHDSGMRCNRMTEITDRVDELVDMLEFALSDPGRQTAPIGRILVKAQQQGDDVPTRLREAIEPFRPYVGTDDRLLYQADY